MKRRPIRLDRPPRIVAAIRADERAVLTVSRLGDVPGVPGTACAGPGIVGAAGVTAALVPEMDAIDREGLRAPARMLRDTFAAVGV